MDERRVSGLCIHEPSHAAPNLVLWHAKIGKGPLFTWNIPVKVIFGQPQVPELVHWVKAPSVVPSACPAQSGEAGRSPADVDGTGHSLSEHLLLTCLGRDFLYSFMWSRQVYAKRCLRTDPVQLCIHAQRMPQRPNGRGAGMNPGDTPRRRVPSRIRKTESSQAQNAGPAAFYGVSASDMASGYPHMLVLFFIPLSRLCGPVFLSRACRRHMSGSAVRLSRICFLLCFFPGSSSSFSRFVFSLPPRALQPGTEILGKLPAGPSVKYMAHACDVCGMIPEV